MRDLLNKYKKLITEDSWDLNRPTLPHGGNDLNDCFSKKHDYRTDECCGKCDKYMEPSHSCYDFCNKWSHCCEMKSLKEEKELSDETEMEEFAEKRGNGAEKISDSAKEKGGLSLLTYNHFRVKLPYYKKASEGKLSMETAKKEYDKFLNKLYSSTKGEMNLSQTAFQELMGKIEVLGELLLESDE